MHPAKLNVILTCIFFVARSRYHRISFLSKKMNINHPAPRWFQDTVDERNPAPVNLQVILAATKNRFGTCSVFFFRRISESSPNLCIY